MKSANIYKILLGCSLLLFVVAMLLIVTGKIAVTGPLIIGALMCLALGFRGFSVLKSFSYTVWIFTAVAASMYYPQLFTTWGSFKLSTLIVPLLQIIMFGMGSQMSLNDFTGVIKMPKGVIIGVVIHYLVMPFTALIISHIFNFPNEIAAGIILIGCVPSGLASNVMSYIGRANLPLAVTIGACSTLLAPFVTPFLMKLIAGQFIEVSVWNMMLDILNMIILPIIAGFIFNMFYNGKDSRKAIIIQLTAYFVIIVLTNMIPLFTQHIDTYSFGLGVGNSVLWFFFLPMFGAILLRIILKGDRTLIKSILSSFSTVGIAVIITIITATGRDSLLSVGALLIFTSLLHNFTGYAVGYGSAWLFRMSEQDRRTIAFECGMQNGGLASGLAMQMGKVATVGLAPAVFGPLMNITGSILASWWRSRPPKE
ncbi:MAG: bile acid:sodium symporter family protein [Tannerella sp.]|jgi:BASS family bile acid:Na+ symporter|nr:bile acid:sodium symporter family protein [Tannerella sp.]